jgi:hypothetical protein
MRLEKITQEYVTDDPAVDYLRKITQRLDAVLGAQPTFLQLVALASLLNLLTIRFSDGLIVNDHDNLVHVLGYAQIDVIEAALLDNPEYDARWVRRMRLTHTFDDTAVEDERERLLHLLRSDPQVASID